MKVMIKKTIDEQHYTNRRVAEEMLLNKITKAEENTVETMKNKWSLMFVILQKE